MLVVRRSAHNPILAPRQSHPWEAVAAFNWSPVASARSERTIHCVYRAMGEPHLLAAQPVRLSCVGYASSTDGLHYRARKPLVTPEAPWERFGCEDPRVTRLNGKYYIFYTALSVFPFRHSGIKVACATTKDFKTIDARHLVTPFNAKAMALFPSRIKGKMTAVLTVNTDRPDRRARIAVAQFSNEEEMWDPKFWQAWYRSLPRHSLRIRRKLSDHIEVGAPPIRTSEGWLLVYSHIQNYRSERKVYGIEAVLLDLEDPHTVLGRTQHPLLVPEETYEQYGQVPKVIFPSGAMTQKDKLWIFYGATDTTSCIAQVRTRDLLRSMRPASRGTIVTRSRHNPILAPVSAHPWEQKATFNPAAIELEGTIHLLYRAMSEEGTSTIGYAASRDGLRVQERLPGPVYGPREVWEQKVAPNGNSGCEDPRIVRLGNRLYMCYTAYNGVNVPRVALSSISVKSFLNRDWRWSPPVLVTPPDIDDKDACFFPERINGRFLFIHRIAHHICVDAVRSLDRVLEDVTQGLRLLGPRRGMWDSRKIGLAGPPLKTKAGWLLFYHGIGEDAYYRVGAALLDRRDPMRVLARTNGPLMEPERRYEKNGQVAQVVFPCGHVLRGDTLFHYYGGADSVVGVATMSLSTVLGMLT